MTFVIIAKTEAKRFLCRNSDIFFGVGIPETISKQKGGEKTGKITLGALLHQQWVRKQKPNMHSQGINFT